MSYCPCLSIGNYKAKPILAFLCDDLHISSKLLYLTTSHYRPWLQSACRKVWQCQSFTPPPLTPPKGSKVKYLNFAITKAIINIFAEILHAGRVAIDMKHIKRDFSLKAWVRAPWVDLGGGAEAKIKLFQNMVMLHIKLKLTRLAATW